MDKPIRERPLRGKLPRRAARGTLPNSTIYDEIIEIDKAIAEVYANHDDPSVQWAVLTFIRRHLEQIFEDYGMEFSTFESATTMPEWK